MNTDFPPFIALGTVGEHPSAMDSNFLGLLVQTPDDLPPLLFGFTLVRDSFVLEKSIGWQNILGKSIHRWRARWVGKTAEDRLLLSWDIDTGWRLNYAWCGKSLEAQGPFNVRFLEFFQQCSKDFIRLAESVLAELPTTVIPTREHAPVEVKLPEGLPMTLVIALHPAYAREAAATFRALENRHFPAPVEGNLFLRQTATLQARDPLLTDLERLRDMYAETGIFFLHVPEEKDQYSIVYGYRYALMIDAPFFLMPEICHALTALVEKTPLGWEGSYLVNTRTDHERNCAIPIKKGRAQLFWQVLSPFIRTLQAKASASSITAESIESALQDLDSAFEKDNREAEICLYNPVVVCSERKAEATMETPQKTDPTDVKAPENDLEDNARDEVLNDAPDEDLDDKDFEEDQDSDEAEDDDEEDDDDEDFDWEPLGVPLHELVLPFGDYRTEGNRLYLTDYDLDQETSIEVLEPDEQTAKGVSALIRIEISTDEGGITLEDRAQDNSLAANGALMENDRLHFVYTCLPFNEYLWLFQRHLAVLSVITSDRAFRSDAVAYRGHSFWHKEDFAEAQEQMTALGCFSTYDDEKLVGEIALTDNAPKFALAFMGFPTALMTFRAEVHPSLGAGLRTTLKMPQSFKSLTDCAEAASYLNDLEMHGASGVEFFGAWCASPTDPKTLAFVSFFENDFKISNGDVICTIWPRRLLVRARWAYRALEARQKAKTSASKREAPQTAKPLTLPLSAPEAKTADSADTTDLVDLPEGPKVSKATTTPSQPDTMTQTLYFPSVLYLTCHGASAPYFDWDKFKGDFVSDKDSLPENLLGCTLVKESFKACLSDASDDPFQPFLDWSAQWVGDEDSRVTISWSPYKEWKFEYRWRGQTLQAAGESKLSFVHFYGKHVVPQMIGFVQRGLEGLGLPVEVVALPQNVRVPVTLPDGIPLSLVIPLHPTCIREAAHIFLKLSDRHYAYPVEGCFFLREVVTFKPGYALPSAEGLLVENYSVSGIPSGALPQRDDAGRMQVFGYRYALCIDLPHFLVHEVCEALRSAVEKNPTAWAGSYIVNEGLEKTGSFTVRLDEKPQGDRLYWYQVPENLRQAALYDRHYPPTLEKIEETLHNLEVVYQDGIALFKSVFPPKDYIDA